MSDQPPLPGSPRSQDDEPTLPYGVPSRQPQQEPQQPPHYEQPTHPYYESPQLPRYAEHSQPPHQTPQYAQQPQYPLPPHQQPGYQPQYPPYEQQPVYYQAPPRTRSKGPWLVAGAIAVVVALFGAAAVIVSRTGGDDTAEAPVPTGSYTDGFSTPSSSPPPTELPSATPTEPTPTPTPSPTPTERRRTLKDVDKGIEVYDDVYVNPATGWRKDRRSTYSVDIVSDTKPGVVIVYVNPIGYPATTALRSITRQLVEADRLTAVRMDPVKSLSPSNSNIGSQAQMGFSGRYAKNGAVISVVGRCTTMTGAESIHNVTVTVCVEARKDFCDEVFRDGNRMLASVARSI